MKFFSTFRPLVHIPLIIGGVILMAGLAFLFGFIVMVLWNWLMPDIFGLGPITYWQAWGLVILSHILFKSFPGTHHSGHRKNRYRNGFKTEFKNKIKDAITRECKGEKDKKEESSTSGEETEKSDD